MNILYNSIKYIYVIITLNYRFLKYIDTEVCKLRRRTCLRRRRRRRTYFGLIFARKTVFANIRKHLICRYIRYCYAVTIYVIIPLLYSHNFVGISSDQKN